MLTASIVMPCFNAAEFVEASVQAILSQTLEDFELVVVDDASTDSSVDILRRLAARDKRIKLVVHRNNLGASRSRNDAIRISSGKYIGFCDADDLWTATKLQNQIDLLSEHPMAAVTFCDSRIIDGKGRFTGELFSEQFPPPKTSPENMFAELCSRNFINMQTVLVRRAVIGEHIYFDEKIKWVEDWWQWIRLSRTHAFLYDNRILAQYRVHSRSTGVTQRPGIRRNRWKVFRRNLAIHRDLPNSLQALLWYKMSIELFALGRREMGLKSLLRSAQLELKGNTSTKRLFAITTKFGFEYCRKLGSTLR